MTHARPLARLHLPVSRRDRAIRNQIGRSWRQLRRMLGEVIDDVHWLLLPGCCRCCGLASNMRRDLCAICSIDLPRDTVSCVTCGQPLPVLQQPVLQQPVLQQPSPPLHCGACLQSPPPFARTVAALRYAAPVDALIADVKFHGRLASVRILGALLADAVRVAYSADALPDLIVPVPLSLMRLMRRGHDQAALLTRRIARELDLPFALNVVRRTRHTAPQSKLRARARQRNLVGAFAARSSVAGLHIAIVDDVLTTGATVREVAKALRAAGALRVDVWVAARTPAVND